MVTLNDRASQPVGRPAALRKGPARRELPPVAQCPAHARLPPLAQRPPHAKLPPLAQRPPHAKLPPLALAFLPPRIFPGDDLVAGYRPREVG
jgi:hypothetical protein